jgi:RHH-type proline utilization regulon transcriptional repressor/proline dehydrogenase/delta 1-pyrroline-5-carboxylate dehydrogenase
MGELIYKNANSILKDFHKISIYAPVGAYKDLLPYLVRRLLENGANS